MFKWHDKNSIVDKVFKEHFEYSNESAKERGYKQFTKNMEEIKLYLLMYIVIGVILAAFGVEGYFSPTNLIIAMVGDWIASELGSLNKTMEKIEKTLKKLDFNNKEDNEEEDSKEEDNEIKTE